ncbi:hypothetical protein C7B62_22100 [Pleurocapsa sp. CCALA 161]|uniref:hypothetical protein n=1 Tax=Pleurocapsa sp. CCALA 161 TaxID=2107688 RepID=UPI000D062FA3|nr:hypothetical protein [Pleurocapsa sp. CCALA 161]PSB06701.1 hypothetical protein C7B62_22100 [Pleurocapsa sp. CCALA 161]
MDNELYLKCLMLCSGHYLCANYSDNWENLSENEQLEFIGDNLWEPMENESPELVQSAIESAAIATYHFIEDLNHKVPENKTSISIDWHIEDVQDIAQEKFNKNLSDEDAFEVLEFVEDNHDACVGINWDVIYCAIETLEQSNFK